MSRGIHPRTLVERDVLIRTAIDVLQGGPTSSPGLTVRGVLLVGASGAGTTAAAFAVAEMLGNSLGKVVEWPRRIPPTFDPDATVALVDAVNMLEDPTRLADWLEAVPSRRLIATSWNGATLPMSISALWSSGRIQRIDVPPLTPTGVEQMADNILGAGVTRGLNEHLFGASEGLPLYVRELLADGTNDGTIIKSGGAWVWWGDSGKIGPRLRDLVRSRVEILPDAEQTALDLVAVSGGAPLRILRQLIGDDELDYCERTGLIRLTDQGILEVSPPARARALISSLSAARRGTLRRRLSEIISREADVPDALVQRAGRWALDEGIVPIPELTIAAAGAANRAGDYHAARLLASAALGTAADSEARVALAHALRFSGQAAEAMAVLEGRPAADRDTPTVVGEPQQEDLVIARAEMRHYVLDDVDGALELIDRAHRITNSRTLEAQRLAHLGFAGRFAECLPAMEELMSDPMTPDVDRARMSSPFVIGLTFAGRCIDAIRYAERSIAIAPQVTDRLPFAQSEAISTMFFARFIGGWSLDDLPPVGPVTVDSLVQIGVGLPLVRSGDAAGALVEFEKALAAFTVSDPSGFMVFALASASAAAAGAGKEHRSLELADQIQNTPWRISGYLEPEIRRLLMWSLYLRGGVGLVSRVGGELIARYEREGLHGANLTMRHTMLRLGVRDVGPSEELLAVNDGPAAYALGLLFRALRVGDDRGLMNASEHFASFGAQVPAAEAAAEAHRAARASGRQAAARASALRVRALTASRAMPMYPLLRDWSSTQQLTPREREVVALAEQQLTNREIAARLNASKRTVEGHLHRAYTKLGVADRRLLREK